MVETTSQKSTKVNFETVFETKVNFLLTSRLSFGLKVNFSVAARPAASPNRSSPGSQRSSVNSAAVDSSQLVVNFSAFKFFARRLRSTAPLTLQATPSSPTPTTMHAHRCSTSRTQCESEWDTHAAGLLSLSLARVDTRLRCSCGSIERHAHL
jgi:hypothetical protein